MLHAKEIEIWLLLIREFEPQLRVQWFLQRLFKCHFQWDFQWKSKSKSTFTIKQGVRQGGILSASHYKRYNNRLMIDVEDRFTGKKIGTVRIPHISVADDMCFVTEDRSEVQPTLSTAETYANREHYTIHPTKKLPYSTTKLRNALLPCMENRFPSRKKRLFWA